MIKQLRRPHCRSQSFIATSSTEIWLTSTRSGIYFKPRLLTYQKISMDSQKSSVSCIMTSYNGQLYAKALLGKFWTMVKKTRHIISSKVINLLQPFHTTYHCKDFQCRQSMVTTCALHPAKWNPVQNTSFMQRRYFTNPTLTEL